MAATSRTKLLGQPVPQRLMLVQHFFSDLDYRTQNWEEWLMTDRGAATHGDLDRLEKWSDSDRNLMKINKMNHQVLSQGSNNPKLQYRPGAEQLKIRLAWKDLGFMDHKLATSQQCSCSSGNHQHPGLHQAEHGQQVEGDPSSLLSCDETHLECRARLRTLQHKRDTDILG